MGNKLYVGNLAYTVADNDLQQAFAAFGAVTSVKVMVDRETGRSKGFAFVEMGDETEAQSAISGLNGQPVGGRNIVVNEARPLEARPFRGTGGTGGPRSPGGYGGSGGADGGNHGGFRSPYGNGPRGGNRGGNGGGSAGGGYGGGAGGGGNRSY